MNYVYKITNITNKLMILIKKIKLKDINVHEYVTR